MRLPFLQELGRSVKQLQHRHHRTLDAGLTKLGTTLAQWDALRAIGMKPDVSSHALAELSFMTDQSFGALASRLEEQGLITRTPGKGRALCHRLTTSGEEMLMRGTSVAEQVLARSFAPLNDSEQAQLLALLSRLLASGSDEPSDQSA